MFAFTGELEWFGTIAIPFLIFVMRIADVSLGTIRIIYVARGNKLIAPILGFFEVFIWILAISNIIQHLDNWINYIAYAGGFATGNFVGMKIEERLAVGISLVRIITKKELSSFSNTLNEKGFPATLLDGHGRDEDVSIIFTIVKRKRLPEVIDLIKTANPKAFFTVEDIRYISHENYMPLKSPRASRRFYSFMGWRKGK
jgi:uncharacterized protein YebE (UPF0316 family)